MTTTATRPLGMFTLLGAASSIHDFIESRLSTVGLSIPRSRRCSGWSMPAARCRSGSSPIDWPA